MLLRSLAVVSLLAAPLSCATAQHDSVRWTAISSTAMGITGDIRTSPHEVVMAGHRIALHTVTNLQTQDLKNAAASFDFTYAEGAVGQLVSLDVPAATIFKNHNTLCGRDAVRYAVFVTLPAKGKDPAQLTMALFSGSKAPDLNPSAVQNSTSYCGDYGYQQSSR